MDTAVSVLQSIYDVYKTIKDGQEQFAETYDRMKALLGQLRNMEDADTLVQTKFLDDYLVLARDFLAYLERYKQRKFLSKVFHQSEMLAEVEGFKERLEALFQHFHLAMGSHIVEHNRNQEASMDELVRGMRFLLQGSNTGHVMKTMLSSDDLLGGNGGASGVQTSGPIAKALKEGDAESLLGFLHDLKLGDGAAMALCEMAEKDDGRDAMVHAGAIPTLLEKISATRPSAESTIRVHAARTIRRLAVRDIYEVAIVEGGAVARLASLVDASLSNSDAEVAAACAALANLTFQPQHKLVLLETPHLLARLVELVRSGSDAQKKHAINVLRELATKDDCANAIRKAQGITVLVDLLHIGSPEQCASALSVLWTMASQEKNRSEIASVGGINAIVAQIRRSSSNDAQRQLAASTLAVLAQDDANDSLIGETDGVELLVNLLRTGTEGQKNSAAWALAELANDAKNATAMMREGVAPALMAAFRSGTDIQRSKAGEALAWIAQLIEDKTTLVQEIGLSSVVSLLRGSVDQKQNAARVIEGIAKDKKYQQQLGKLGAIELLVDLVKNHSPKINGVKTLRRLATLHGDEDDNNDTNENPELIEAAGGVDVLVDLLMKRTYNADETFDHVLDALSTISSSIKYVVLGRVVAAGGLSILLETLETGSLAQQHQVARLILQSIYEDIGVTNLAACTRALLKVVQPVEDVRPDNNITETVLQALVFLSQSSLGRSILVKESGIKVLLSVLTSTVSSGAKKNAGTALGNLIPEYAKRVVADGALDVYQSLLNTTSAELQIAALFGLALLVGEGKASVVRKTIVQTPGLCKRIIRLLDVGADEEAISRAASMLDTLTRDKTLAVELGPLHGLEALVTLVQSRSIVCSRSKDLFHESFVLTHSAATLRNLAQAPENIETLIEIGAIDAAIALLHDDVGDSNDRMTALQLLAFMSANREAGDAIIASNELIAQCVKRLQCPDEYKADMSKNINGRKATLDKAVSVLYAIDGVYKTISDSQAQEQFAGTYERMKDLLSQLLCMEDMDVPVQAQFLDKYLVLARDFLGYLEKYSQRKLLSRDLHQSEVLATVEGFTQQQEALFQHFALAACQVGNEEEEEDQDNEGKGDNSEGDEIGCDEEEGIGENDERDDEEEEENDEEVRRWFSWTELCLQILVNINKLLTTSTNDPDTESDDEDAAADKGSRMLSFYKQIVDARGLMPLMEVLEEREPGKRTDLIKLLDALAANDTAAKIKIGGVVEVLVEVVRDGTDVQEQIAAAAAIVTLVEGSRRNAGAAIRARVGDAFVQLLKANDKVTEASKASTAKLITNLLALKSSNATEAAEKLVIALASEAVADANESCVAAFEVLEELFESTSFVKVFVSGDAFAVCVEALKTCGSAETATCAVVLLSKVSHTKHRKTLLENGVVDVLSAALKEVSLGPRFAEAAQQIVADLRASAC